MTLQLPVSSAELTRAEQKILDFINTNPDTFLFSSIGQLAQQLELSDATLSRFARHVGCQDFKELKNLVLEHRLRPGRQAGRRLTGGGELFAFCLDEPPAALSAKNG